MPHIEVCSCLVKKPRWQEFDRSKSQIQIDVDVTQKSHYFPSKNLNSKTNSKKIFQNRRKSAWDPHGLRDTNKHLGFGDIWKIELGEIPVFSWFFGGFQIPYDSVRFHGIPLYSKNVQRLEISLCESTQGFESLPLRLTVGWRELIHGFFIA